MRYALFLAIFALLSPTAFYGNPVEEPQKIYVQPAQIVINDQGIFVYVENEWISAESISIDSYGMYAQCSNPDLRTWRCTRCNFINAYWDDYCQGSFGDGKCLAPRPPRKISCL